MIQLKHLVHYNALAYAWEHLSTIHPLVWDGKILHIHKDLHEALPDPAGRSSILPLWIDAMCIDEMNEMEKLD